MWNWKVTSLSTSRLWMSNTVRVLSRSGSIDPLTLSRTNHNQRLLKMETSGIQQRQKSSAETRRFARPDEVNYALRQNMGEGYTRRTVMISALGTTYNMVYGEWVPVDRPVEGCPAVICIHGTPATDAAFRPIGSRIASFGYRVLAINFPGMGYTEIDPEGKYGYLISDKVELVKAFISALHINSVAMVIGHSLGTQVVGGVAADPELEGIVQSACFLCAIGITPHRVQKLSTRIPYAAYIIYKIMYIPVVGWLTMYVMSKYMHYLGFRGKTAEAQVLSIYEASTMDFDEYGQTLKKISDTRLPVLLMYGLDDTIVEPELIQENIDILGIPESNIKDYHADGQANISYNDGILRRVVRFASGGHRIQFTNPEKTCEEIISLLSAIGNR